MSAPTGLSARCNTFRLVAVAVAACLSAACSTTPRLQPHIEQGDLAMLEVQDMEVSADGSRLIMTVPDLLFASGKDELSYGAEKRLDRLVTALRAMPEQPVILEGHADSRGSDRYNVALSLRRANAVRGYLINHGVDSGRVQLVARGELLPVAGNDTAEGRQQNRRVEIGIGNGLTPAPPVR